MSLTVNKRKPVFVRNGPAAEARWLRARIIGRLNREYLQGAISLTEFEHELDALREYIPMPHEADEGAGEENEEQS